MTRHSPTPEQVAVIEAISRGRDSVMIQAYAGCAKALRSDQRVVTPTGLVPIGQLQVGELVIGADGMPYPILGVYPQGERDLFKVEFSDGTFVIADEDHLWLMQRADERRLRKKGKVRSTWELSKKVKVLSGPNANWGKGTRAYWFLPMCAPVNFAPKSGRLPIDPWLLGILLGDGCLQERSVGFSSADQEIVDAITVIAAADYGLKTYRVSQSSYDYRITTIAGAQGTPGKTGIFNPLLSSLRGLGLSGTKSQEKFVPEIYKTASVGERLAILQGLCDSDGYADKTRAVFTSASSGLASDVKFLTESLGGTATWNEFETEGLMAFRVNIKLPAPLNPFRLARKRVNYFSGQRPPYRALEKITPAGRGEATCIKVASPDSLFLTENFIVTHNTTTLEMASKFVKVPSLSIQFNRKTAIEAKGKFPSNFNVKTLNGLGFLAWARANPGVAKFEIDERKLGKLITHRAKAEGAELSSEQWDSIRQTVQGAMKAGIVPSECGPPGLRPDTADEWQGLALDSNAAEDEADFIAHFARGTLVESIRLARAGTISFDEQIYCATLLGGRFPKFPVVFGDEGQDFSLLDHAMLRQCVREDGRLVIVGDSRQSIYAFRGSDGRSLENIRALRPSWTDRLLGTTFRCPKRIVARQQHHAPGFRAWHTNADGMVERFGGFQDDSETEPRTWNWGQLKGLLDEGASRAILCRNNAPLLGMAFKLIRQGIGPVMLGRDIGKGLTALSRKLFANDDTPRDTCLGLLDEWELSETSQAQANGDERKAEGIQDRAACLRAVFDNSGVRDAGGLRRALQVIFSKERGDVTLSTIHRAKGLEWDCVLHLDPWRIPSKRARKAAAEGDPIPLEQELNLGYVCETRTRNVLALASLEDFR